MAAQALSGRGRHLVRVRIRGIYATALTRWALREGFQVVQASRVIADRFGIPILEVPADVTLKNSDDDPSELLVVGYTWAVERVVEALRRTLPYSFYWVSRLPLHATVKATVTGECRASIAGVEAEVVAESCPEPGSGIVAGVVRPGVKPGERPRLAPGARVLGDYAIVYESEKPRVTVSEHIRSPEKRAELMAIASRLTSRGLGVHWRSSSRYADRSTLEQHLDELAARLEEARKRAEQGGEGVYSEGETVALVRLSAPDKEALDRLRAEATPTAPLHHSVKSLDPELSIAIDYAEKLLEQGVEGDKLLAGLRELQAEKLAQARRIKLVHVKPDSTVIELGPAELLSVERRGQHLVLVVERRVRGRGVYDGLEVEKTPGDRIVSEIDTSSWSITHRYYSPDGTLKGVYVNINTPPEVTTSGAIVYLDLEVDVVKKPGEKPRMIDEEALRQALEQGIITREMYEKALAEARAHTGEHG